MNDDNKRRVLNTDDTPEYVKVSTHFRVKDNSVGKYDSLKFTDNSIDFMKPMEDEQLLNNQAAREIQLNRKQLSVFDDPSQVAPNNYCFGSGTENRPQTIPMRETAYTPNQTSQISGPAFFSNAFTLTVISIILFIVIGIEIFGLIAIF